MQTSGFIGPKTATQFAIALVLLVTFSTGILVGRHVAGEIRGAVMHAARVSGPHFPYELDQPLRKLILPAILREASAVSYIDGSQVGIVQDEQGTLFIYSLVADRVMREIDFADQGDYEGLVMDRDEAWVLRSDGTLFHLGGLHGNAVNVTRLDTHLQGKDDTEGLALDSAHRQLLIGLKGLPKIDGKRRKDKRAIYAFRLDEQTLSPGPYFLLDMAEIKRVYSSQLPGGAAEKFDADKKSDFQPSDLAVHPVTGHLYHIAARGQLLVVSDRSGQVYFVRELPKSVFRQPEGISFDPRGNLIIVSEGGGSEAVLFEFRYQPLVRAVEAPTPATTGFGPL